MQSVVTTQPRGQHGVICCGKHKSKGLYKGMNRHKAFWHSCPLRTISADDYGDADSAASFQLEASTTFALLCHTFAALHAHQAPKIFRINESFIPLNNACACKDQRTTPNYRIFQMNEGQINYVLLQFIVSYSFCFKYSWDRPETGIFDGRSRMFNAFSVP